MHNEQESSTGQDHLVKADSTNEASQSDLRELRDIVNGWILSLTDGKAVFEPLDTASLDDASREEMRKLGIDIGAALRWLPWSTQLVEWYYPMHPADLKVLLVLCVITIFHTDDVLVKTPHVLDSFQSALLARKPKGDPLLDCLCDALLPRMWAYFDPLVASSITNGFWEFLIGTSLELLGHDSACMPSAPGFPEFVRLKAGIPLPFSQWVFHGRDAREVWQAMPDVIHFMDHANDILSLYKEELAADHDNYIHMRADADGKGVLETLEELCEEVVQAVERASKTMAPEARDTWHTFVARYIHFHTVLTSRYRLDEVLA